MPKGEKGDAAITVFIEILMALGAILLTAAIALSQTDARNGNGFAVAGVFSVLGAVLLAIGYFVFDPMIRRASRWRQRQLAETASGPTGTLVIEEARYGAEGFAVEDRTAQVRGRVRDDRLDFPVDNNELGPDPAPGQPKKLWVRYRLGNSASTEVVFHESERCVIPPESETA
jgi:hypothetical protein